MPLPDVRQFGIDQCRQSLMGREKLSEWLMEQRESINRCARFRPRSVVQYLRWQYQDFNSHGELPVPLHDSGETSDASHRPWTENPRHKFTRFLNALTERLRNGQIRSKEEMRAFMLCFDGMDEFRELEFSVLEAIREKRLALFREGLLPGPRRILTEKSDPDYKAVLRALEFFPRFRETLFLDTIEQRSTVVIYRKLIRKLLFG
ncbi:hypothetical protein HZA43_03020 [Candidatus Peregrinibacteria bacterium]|nr:hypothetical protein [Candidatus Peregrinibacteria bacterium]